MRPCRTRRSASRVKCTAAQRLLAEAPQSHGFGQGGVGFRPSSGSGQDPAVVRAAERRDGGQSSALGDHLADSDPLIGAPDIVGVLAGREELAEDLLEHAEVLDVTAGDRRERFVEQHHAFFVAVAVHEAGAEVGQRHELQIRVARRRATANASPKAHLLRRPVILEHAQVQRNPATFGRIGRVTQQRLGARQPTAAHRPVADDLPDTCTRGCERRALPRRDRRSLDAPRTPAPNLSIAWEKFISRYDTRASPSITSPRVDPSVTRSNGLRAPAASPARSAARPAAISSSTASFTPTSSHRTWVTGTSSGITTTWSWVAPAARRRRSRRRAR